jgi:hypothetical protein
VNAFGKDHQWLLLENKYEIFDLTDEFGESSMITYAWAQIEMPEEKEVMLGIGSDDGVKVWLNSELVHEYWVCRGVGVDNDCIPVTFQKGMNQLVLKIQNQGGPWGFCCRLLPATITLSPEGANLDLATYDGLVPGEFMKKWLVLGPLPYPVQQDIWFASEEGQRMAFDTDTIDPVNFTSSVTFDNGDRQLSAEWSLLKSESYAIDLKQLDVGKNDFQIAYLWSQIETTEDREAILGIGSDDGIKVWLNGELVHENWLYRGVVADNDLVHVRFKKGKNQLVLKVQNALGPWGFCCRLLDE